jgi:hypothetical protein
LAKISAIPGFVLDELTEYAMAKEGIDLDDLVPKYDISKRFMLLL